MCALNQIRAKVLWLFHMRVKPYYHMETAEDVWLKAHDIVWLPLQQDVELAPLSELFF